ncbi:MAG TPA: sugar MFS transporter [Verrucomicrobiae bacterium]
MNPSIASTTGSTQNSGQNYRGPFAIMTVLFFMWGFMTVFNDILIPRFKEAFTLDYLHAMLVQFAFFGAYFVGSLIYFIISARLGDPIAKIGYKNGVITGLVIAAIGSALFWPAATLAPRSSIIAPDDFRNFPALTQTLAQQKDAVSVFIYNGLSEPTRQLLSQGGSGNTEALKKDLADDLNKIAKGPSIYDEQRFAGVKLADTTKELLKSKTEDKAVAQLNLCLLQDAYAGEISRYLVPFWIFLVALFVVGLGFAMLQIAANPYVTILGPERTASSRLNLAQAFNSVGTTVGPLIGGYLIFQYFAKTGAHGAESVKIPYLIFCIIFLALAGVFFLIRLPHVGEGKVERGMGALKYPHVLLGVLAIFMYVGGEVSIGSAIISFLGQKSVAGLDPVEASKYVSLFWGGMLIGRFMGAVELSEMKKVNKQIFLVAIPLVCFLLFWILRSWDSDLKHFDFTAGWAIVKNYLPLLVLCWVLFQCGKAMAGRTLLIFGLTIVALLAVAIGYGGHVAMWCIVGIGLFTSIGWPNIFSLALDGGGIYKGQISSLLVMAILGGALLPPLQGTIADHFSIQLSFIVPMIAYAYVAFYGAMGHKIGRKNTSIPLGN